ncbi:MAG: phosphoglycerate kinase [Minisyncoccia bacterium]
MRTLRDIPQLEGIPVLLRTSQAVNEVRVREALPTIEFLRSRHAKVILATHVSGKGTESALPMYEALKPFVPGIRFCGVSVGEEAREAARDLPPGGILMLENLRRNPGEEKNDPEFTKELASLADVFVQDSFDTCHREHASIVGVPTLLPSYAGLTLLREVAELTKALKPARPALAVIGGAKFSTKEPVLQALLRSYDHVFVGGALANDFLMAKGFSVGASLVSSEGQQEIRELLKNPRLITPVDVVVAAPHEKRAAGRTCSANAVQDGEMILDAGAHTAAALVELVNSAKTVLWNGPLGLFEDGFADATRVLARAIVGSNAYSILGGGDTIAAVEDLGILGDFSFVSTGGGAMLDFLAYGTLPGIKVLG